MRKRENKRGNGEKRKKITKRKGTERKKKERKRGSWKQERGTVRDKGEGL
jgi:hypothetical protein